MLSILENLTKYHNSPRASGLLLRYFEVSLILNFNAAHDDITNKR